MRKSNLSNIFIKCYLILVTFSLGLISCDCFAKEIDDSATNAPHSCCDEKEKPSKDHESDCKNCIHCASEVKSLEKLTLKSNLESLDPNTFVILVPTLATTTQFTVPTFAPPFAPPNEAPEKVISSSTFLPSLQRWLI